MTFLTNLGVTEILCSFRLVLEGKTGKDIPESSRLEFLEKFLAKTFALLDAEDNNSGPLNRGGIADFSLLRTVLAEQVILLQNKLSTLSSVRGLYAQIREKKFDLPQ